MKRFIVFLLNLLITSTFFGQVVKGRIDSTKIPELHMHYQEEFTFDFPSDPQEWEKLEPGLNVSFATTDKLFLRSELPGIKETLIWKATGWKGERLNAQILVWAKDSLEQVRVVLEELNSGAHKLAKEQVEAKLVRYVVSDYPYGAQAEHCATGDGVYLMPDRLEEFDRFDLPGGTLRPIWLSIELPQDIVAGLYLGTVTVIAGKEKMELNLEIEVQDQVLPKPSDWDFRLDLWQNPWVVANYFNLEPWSKEHKDLLRKHLSLYADTGGKYITTYAVYSPWSDNSYYKEGTMIDWAKMEDGSWEFNYDVFDEYVELSMEVGIKDAITLYTLLPWGNRFRYMDATTGEYIYVNWEPQSKEFQDFWNLFLTDLRQHLEEKGWFDITYLGINENPMEYTLAASNLIKKHSEDWRITYAGNWHEELDLILDDYSLLYGQESSMEEVAARAARGQSTTFYVCCNPARPNNFVFSPPVEGRWISWYAAAYGYDGFLRWAYDAWPQDPLRDARHVLWPAGDTFMVYPGAQSSIRFEKQREGIVDFEKLAILREKANNSKDKDVKKLIQDLDKYYAEIVKISTNLDGSYTPEEMKASLDKGLQLVNELSRELVH